MALREFFAQNQGVVRARVTGALGSSPRDAGAEMYVSATEMTGTIGGGQLEYMALQRAREMLQGEEAHAELDVPLGPEIGQCCGGRAIVALDRVDATIREAALVAETEAEAVLPMVMIFGAGHVGRALAKVLALLPVQVKVVDSREAELQQVEGAQTCLTALPEREIDAAPEGAAFVIMTHDHGLDYLLVAQALTRRDAVYVGMIGSTTKRAKFFNWARQHDSGIDVSRLVCPMGSAGLGDKRPAVIAAFIATELMSVFAAARDSAPMEAIA
ncbi:xanthine dehydrogenase accessory protein XdhC [Aquicoccus sp. G2-2]|uniref:xanthine dehydrogenase accessory protein XdhC n=1 Tax=Aquicoccus sp. G2-2 TaxID=3092120 RepID=UPI002AE0251E|nr:xanthine dehydrogenase accessory protein XdhC [Aquicoccus sp. G2-2]MEA1114268.1 xanthine dehydrogenase accessory protein XdhC [Aquicoccus sp. G2-2]